MEDEPNVLIFPEVKQVTPASVPEITLVATDQAAPGGGSLQRAPWTNLGPLVTAPRGETDETLWEAIKKTYAQLREAYKRNVPLKTRRLIRVALTGLVVVVILRHFYHRFI